MQQLRRLGQISAFTCGNKVLKLPNGEFLHGCHQGKRCPRYSSGYEDTLILEARRPLAPSSRKSSCGDPMATRLGNCYAFGQPGARRHFSGNYRIGGSTVEGRAPERELLATGRVCKSFRWSDVHDWHTARGAVGPIRQPSRYGAVARDLQSQGILAALHSLGTRNGHLCAERGGHAASRNSSGHLQRGRRRHA
jgi:hypothetical protein